MQKKAADCIFVSFRADPPTAKHLPTERYPRIPQNVRYHQCLGFRTFLQLAVSHTPILETGQFPPIFGVVSRNPVFYGVDVNCTLLRKTEAAAPV